ncbi:TetR/AcrR family transcriptional regulator C-terminal domain-containing protein [Streptomyces sp. NPDC005438]|uniref:TetR/AcrR family transcriptional regulator C-terminal domain-containing protein n=1 Tax=Streptomyces sp. NPDC005438 TaxID=3156880 RepID=UPI0033ADEF4A
MATTPRLDRDQVVHTALELLNEVGLEGLTLRRIAKELNVQAPALYWHFRNKQALLDEMATTIYRRLLDQEGTPGPEADWKEWLVRVHQALRRSLLSYRDGARVFSGSRFTDLSHAAVMEDQLGRMTRAGFTPATAARAAFVVYAFTEGFVIEEQGVHPMPGERTPGYDTAQRAARLAGFPLAAATSEDLFDDYEARFEEGLRAVIAGVEWTYLGRSPHPHRS